MEPSTSAPDAAEHDPALEVIQRTLADAVRAYGGWVSTHGETAPFPAEHAASRMEVAVTVAAMLKATEIYSFEIAAMFNV